MRKRMILMLVVTTAFLVVIGLVKFFQIRAAIAQGASWQPPPESVTTIVAREEQWPAAQSAIGTVTAVHGVTVSADLPGVVASIEFESGRRVRAGEVLVRLDTRQERAQLAAADAQRELSRLNLERMRQLLDKGVVAQAEFDRVVAESKQAEARVDEIRATIERKTLRAPFAGVLGIRRVNLGQYLNGGDPVVPLQSMDPVYVDFALPQQDVRVLRIGAEVRVSADSAAIGQASGRITAINSVVDEATRNVQVQAAFDNTRGGLRPGMFVDVQILMGSGSRVVALPASAISYAPYGNSVFVVTTMRGPDGRPYRGVRQQIVRLGGSRGDQIAIASGIRPGEEIVTSGAFKLRNGGAVQVNNATAPANDPAPKPEDS
ncbi:MAG: efflux RND transporter periplasmic adaptor subunit [Candidatus Eisenbacteria bacterium]|uniref:Efflux RND transporter periplasmic adaptor subunit n=1 Tax=Eiseniibacteriota bacterium TaxID=2212470 RepID=A0A538TX60_UNCEI|nr:MAG: efflux RND transporter periplasmic adaptor subunit [Candidatus Eisenbacteria bacterium]